MAATQPLPRCANIVLNWNEAELIRQLLGGVKHSSHESLPFPLRCEPGIENLLDSPDEFTLQFVSCSVNVAHIIQ